MEEQNESASKIPGAGIISDNQGSAICAEATTIVEESIFSWTDGKPPSVPSIDEDPDQTNIEDVMLGNTSVDSSAVSFSSSIYKFIEENGRTYHSYKDGRYFLPNDTQEQERLNLQHHIFCTTFGGDLHLAPISPSSTRILDIATGTGNWAIEMAAKYPQAHVIGTDLSPIQPNYLPENCAFKVDDAEDPWKWSEPFDYIHGRAIVTCFRKPKAVFQQAFDNLTPGGYLELQDTHFPFSFMKDPGEDCWLKKWNDLALQALDRGKLKWSNVRDYKGFLEDIGFEDVVEKVFYWPTSPWAKGKFFKTLSMLVQEDMASGVAAVSLRLFKLLGWDESQIKSILDKALADMKNPKYFVYLEIRVVYGRKPLSPMQPGSTAVSA